MADLKISQLPNASTPLAGTEVVPIVQSGVTDKITVDNLLTRLTAAPPAIGTTTPAAGKFTDLTTNGNTVLGDATTDTLNVGNGGIIKDASGNVGICISPIASRRMSISSPGAASGEYPLALVNPYSGAYSTVYQEFYAAGSVKVQTLAQRNNAGNGGFYIINTSNSGGSLVEGLRIDDTQAVLATGLGGLGYGTGAGGTVTQSTSKTTAVTLNKPCGQITMNGASLASGATVAFLLSNTVLTNANDQVVVSLWAGNANYALYSVAVATGSGGAYIIVKNEHTAALADAVVLNFAVIKGATA